MTKILTVLLLVLLFSIPVFADGPGEEEAQRDRRQEQLDRQVNKPQRTISTVGPVPVNTVPPAAVVPGSSSTGIGDVDVLVAPGFNQGSGRGRNNDRPDAAPTTIVAP